MRFYDQEETLRPIVSATRDQAHTIAVAFIFDLVQPVGDKKADRNLVLVTLSEATFIMCESPCYTSKVD
jgi:hypothetical protein